MKRAIFSKLILLSFIGLSAQEKWLNPTPSGWINSKIQFINESTGFLMNYNGDFFISKDTGNTWQLYARFPTVNSPQTFKIENSTGVIPVFDSAVYISSDNGSSWIRKPGPCRSINITWCDIVGRDTIFVLGIPYNGTQSLYRSVDRGDTWQRIIDGIYPFVESSIDFITSQRGYARKPDGIYKTTNGGLTWQHVYTITTSDIITSQKFYDTLTGIACRSSGEFIRTTDGGVTWTSSPDIAAQDIYDIFFVDKLHVYACGEDGIVYKTVDGGASWTLAGSYPYQEYYDLYSQYFFNNNYGLAVGHSGRIIKTRDGGANWVWHSPLYNDVQDLSFGSQNVGYAVSRDKIFKSTDAGKTWDSLAFMAPANKWFARCYFTNADTGFVTTNGPFTVYRTVNGGQSWSIIQPLSPYGPYDGLTAMSFFSRDTGYISVTGTVNGILKTYNAGLTWTEIGSQQYYQQLSFVSDKVGYAATYIWMYKTIDGGLTWTQFPMPFLQDGISVLSFVNEMKGFAVVDQGKLRITTDGGNNWTNLILDPNEFPEFTKIRFFNDSIGYALNGYTSYGYFKTTDGGYNWKRNGTSPNQLFNMQFQPDSTVIFSGQKGDIFSRSIGDFSIDSLTVIPDKCTAQFTAKIRSFMFPVDSIWFQYGKTVYTSTILGNPSKVFNVPTYVTATATGLEADSINHVRVKIKFRGDYYYSADVNFKGFKAPSPSITAAGNILTCSMPTGNQWSLDGNIIPGATNQSYTATASGSYAVTSVLNGCPTFPSAPYNFTVTAVSDITAWGKDIQIFPNPTESGDINVIVHSTRKLGLQVTDIAGRTILKQDLINGPNKVLLPQLQAGAYAFVIRDKKTLEGVMRKVLKL